MKPDERCEYKVCHWRTCNRKAHYVIEGEYATSAYDRIAQVCHQHMKIITRSSPDTSVSEIESE